MYSGILKGFRRVFKENGTIDETTMFSSCQQEWKSERLTIDKKWKQREIFLEAVKLPVGNEFPVRRI